MRSAFTRVVAAAFLVSAACAHPSTSSRPMDRNVLTQDQLGVHHYNSVYDAVAELRSNWLLTRGPDSFSNPSEVKVYFDNTLMGGVETLKEIATSNIVYVKHFDGPSATSRWGIGHGAGVIYVSTHPLTGDP